MMTRTPTRNIDNSGMTVEGTFGRYTALGFRSASVAEREGRCYTSGSGDSHSRYDRPILIAESRANYRDNGIYKAMIDRAVDYIIGNGFALQVKTNDPKTNKKIEYLWNSWNIKPEIRGLLLGFETAQTFLRECILTGDIGAIKTNKNLIQLIEAEQIAGNKTSDGIEKDINNAPSGFWVCPYDRGTGYLKTDAVSARKIAPENFLFMTNTDRPSSTRGVPACQSSFPMLHRINDVCDSEAIAMQLLSRIAMSITKEQGAQDAFLTSKPDPNKAGQDTSASFGSRIHEYEYALTFHGNPGDKIEGIDHNIPGKNFGESLRLFLRLLGLPLGMPLELIFLDWTKSNYSQSRAVLEQAFQSFLKWQQKMIGFYYTPLLEWLLPKWRISEPLGNRKEIPYSWITPTFPWIDQLKETQAKGMMIDRALMSHGEACKSRGQDRDEVVEIREKEIRDSITRAKKIQEDTGIEVDWKLFAGLASDKGNEAKSPKTPADGSEIDDETDNQEKKDE